MNAGHEPVDFESSDSIEDQLNLDAPDSSMVEPTLSVEEGEHEASLTAALSDEVGSWFTNLLKSLARCGSIDCSMVPPEDIYIILVR